MEQTILGLATMVMAIASQSVELSAPALMLMEQKPVLAKEELDLTKRLPIKYGSEVFADNILLALHYLKGDICHPELGSGSKMPKQVRHDVDCFNIDWDKIREPFTVEFTLRPGEVFAFHDNVLKDFQNPKVTMHSKFFMEEGYLALGGLGGNGVCHLASLMNWVAKDAGLDVTAKVNHDFYPVPGVPKENGTAILSQSPEQNLYIKNNQNKSVEFIFKADSQKVALEIW